VLVALFDLSSTWSWKVRSVVSMTAAPSIAAIAARIRPSARAGGVHDDVRTLWPASASTTSTEPTIRGLSDGARDATRMPPESSSLTRMVRRYCALGLRSRRHCSQWLATGCYELSAGTRVPARGWTGSTRLRLVECAVDGVKSSTVRRGCRAGSRGRRLFLIDGPAWSTVRSSRCPSR